MVMRCSAFFASMKANLIGIPIRRLASRTLEPSETWEQLGNNNAQTPGETGE
jgi:hypothetical protein